VKRTKQIVSAILQWVVAIILMLIIWNLVAPHVSKLFIVKPGPVWDQIKLWYDTNFLWNIIGTTASEAAAGYGIGAAIGIVLALLVGLLPSIFGKVVEPVVVAIYAAPKFVLIPLFFVWLGAGFYPRVLLISLSVFALLFVNTVTGIRTVDPDRVRVFQLLGADRQQIARKMLLPHTMGYIATGLTTAAPFAVTIAVGSEILFGATGGLGGTMYTQSELFNAKQVLAALAVATALSAVAITIGRGLGVKIAGPGGRFARL